MDPIQLDSRASTDVLKEAARSLGVEQVFWDIWGKRHEAPDDVLKSILGSLGVYTTSDKSLQQALALRSADEWTRLLPPTLVVLQEDASFSISVPLAVADTRLKASIELEDGSKRESWISLKDELTGEQCRVKQRDFVKKKISLGAGLPLGYHRLTLNIAGSPESQARLVVCPSRAFQPEWLQNGKAAGIAVSLYGVRSSSNWGCGDCTDLQRLIDWAADDVGVSFVALNPLHAIPNRQPYNTSPYLPNSIFFRNHIYLDLEAMADFKNSACARRMADSPKVQFEIAALRDSQYVEYERVSRLKLRFLKLLFRTFLAAEFRQKTDRAKAFQAYVEKEGKLLDLFAIHSALDEALHKSDPNAWHWHDWPAAYQDPDSLETQAFAKENWRTVLLHKYIQWQLDVQFEQTQAYAQKRGLSIGLYHDLALATDKFGSDLWAHRPFYAEGCRVGSPPDDFSPKGQDWSFPPPNSVRHFEDGYRLFAESIRKASAHGGALRIDHVMRFFRLYWIPDGKDATEGTYVQDRFEDLVRVLALESVRGQFVVVGEDLGTVPDQTRATLRQFGILSYRLFYFERDQDGRFHHPQEYPRQALVSASTHDLPTLAGFWQNADIDARRAAGVIGDEHAYRAAVDDRAAEKQKILNLLKELNLLPEWFPREAQEVPELTGDLHNAIIGFLASTPAQLLVVNQEDLFKDVDQQNLPGTTAEHPNWRHKMKFTLEELTGETAQGYSAMLRSWLDRTGRRNYMK